MTYPIFEPDEWVELTDNAKEQGLQGRAKRPTAKVISQDGLNLRVRRYGLKSVEMWSPLHWRRAPEKPDRVCPTCREAVYEEQMCGKQCLDCALASSARRAPTADGEEE